MSSAEWTYHCAEFAAESVKKQTGRDIWKELGGCPRSWREGKELYERHGCRSLAELVTLLFGEPIPAHQAQAGDLCMVAGALGVCRGTGAVEFINGYHRLERVTAAWRVTGG